MERQSQFSRVRNNEAKLGAYYTDPTHCKDLFSFLKFDTEEETCVLEPSIGDGTAVRLVTGAEKNDKIRIFGVELNDQTYEEHLKENDAFEDILKADFLTGVRIKNGCFSFCFGNPPYLNDSADDEGASGRVERLFLEKVTGYLKVGAILVWVIPYSSFIEDSAFRYFNTRYDILNVMKFREEEYKKWKQVVIFAKKRSPHMISKEELTSRRARYALEDLRVVPSGNEVGETEKIEVPTSKAEDVTLFASKDFDAEAAAVALPLNLKQEVKRCFNDLVTAPLFVVNNIGRPPIPLKKDSMYLLAVSGAGQGLTGSEENHDLHLQRGVAEVVDEETVNESEDGKTTLVVTSRTQITMSIIENDGRISTLL